MISDRRAEEALRASQLVHDLRTFLTVIYLAGQMIEEQSACSRALHFVRRIMKSCESLDRMINERVGIAPLQMGSLASTPRLRVVASLQGVSRAHKLQNEETSLPGCTRVGGEIPRTVYTSGPRLHHLNCIDCLSRFLD